MFKILRLLGIIGHSPESLHRERVRHLMETENDIDLLAMQLDEARAQLAALRSRKVRLSGQVKRYQESRRNDD